MEGWDNTGTNPLHLGAKPDPELDQIYFLNNERSVV